MLSRRAFSRSLVTLCSGLTLSCMAHQSSGQRLIDSARDLNEASRFGRLDVAAELTAAGARESFLERRRSWGNDIRVVDISVANVKMDDPEHAQVLVRVAWTHLSDSTLRNTELVQRWENIELSGWALARESRTGGAAGLFGESASEPKSKPRRDVHFPSRSLGHAN